jgi:NarL family two-component system response regulator LiaR
MTKQSIKILIADDHPLVREGLRGLIATEPDMELIGEASDGDEAVKLARSLQPDVILLDLIMPNKTGIEAIIEIKEDNPDARILVVTSFGEDENVFPAIKAGALGYLLKDSSPRELLAALREVYRGEPSLHPSVALKLIRELNQPSPPNEGTPLAEREVEVLKLVAQGLSNHEICETLVIAERTVSKHVSSIIEKLHVSNRTQVALYALKEGFATLDPA